MICKTCEQDKPQDEYYFSGPKGKYHKSCKECEKKRVTDRFLLVNYGLTVEQYQDLLDAQNGVCMICQQPETTLSKYGVPKKLAVDHDHSCCPGKVTCGECIRGLLCQRCNMGLGLLGDNPQTYERLQKYLINSQEPVALESCP